MHLANLHIELHILGKIDTHIGPTEFETEMLRTEITIIIYSFVKYIFTFF